MWGLLFSPGSAWRIAGGSSANDPLTPNAPSLTWDTDVDDNTPTFTADFDDTKVHASGDIDGSNYDVIELNWDTDSGFGSVDSDTNTLDAAELLAGEVAFTTGTLADGTWYARCRHNHVVAGVDHFSPWSNTVSETIVTGDSTAPILSSATGTKTGYHTADLSVSTDEGNGTLYWVVTTSSTGPSAAQVKAGNDHTGSAAADSGSQAVAGTGVQNISGGATGLNDGTAYYAHYMHEDASTNQSIVATSSSFTTDAYQTESETVFAAFTTPPSDTRKAVIDACIAKLKTDSVWSKLDGLWMFAANDSQAALINWVTPGTSNATLTDAPTFTQDRGFATDGSNDAISLLNPSTQTNCVQDSAMFALWSRTAGQTSAASGATPGAASMFINPRNASDLASYRIQDNTSTTPASADGVGLFMASRTSSTSKNLYKNGSSISSVSVSSTAETDATLLLGSNLGGFNARQYAMAAVGSGFDATEADNFYDAIATYMTAVGA